VTVAGHQPTGIPVPNSGIASWPTIGGAVGPVRMRIRRFHHRIGIGMGWPRKPMVLAGPDSEFEDAWTP